MLIESRTLTPSTFQKGNGHERSKPDISAGTHRIADPRHSDARLHPGRARDIHCFTSGRAEHSDESARSGVWQAAGILEQVAVTSRRRRGDLTVVTLTTVTLGSKTISVPSASSIDSISGCLYKKVVEPLDGVHGRLFDRALCDLADGGKRHAAGAGNRALRDAFFPQSCHHIVVKSDVGVHGTGA